jgi:hypothetical protein
VDSAAVREASGTQPAWSDIDVPSGRPMTAYVLTGLTLLLVVLMIIAWVGDSET